MKNTLILKGNIVYTPNLGELVTVEHGYLISIKGRCLGVFQDLPMEYKEFPVKDYGDAIILPGLIDLHLHAPQYSFRGLGMDMELLEWLEVNTFPEESKYAQLDYAARAYALFVEDLVQSPTTRACVFATIHTPASLLLMDLMEDSGLVSYVGKVNMDRNCPDYLRENSPEEALVDTRHWVETSRKRHYVHTAPIITPRFVPTCTDPLMAGLQRLQEEFSLPVQSHLSENYGEIAWVKELCPWAAGYPEVYDHFGMLQPTKASALMAHCVHLSTLEAQLLKERGTFIAHCPGANANIASGIAPIRHYLDLDMAVGLGTDIAGGFSLSIFRAITDAIQQSKLRWRLVDDQLAPLTVTEGFYLATKGGGKFFGQVGSFEKDYAFDAIVLTDTKLRAARSFTLQERFERLIYSSENCSLLAKYVDGREVRLSGI